MTPMEAIVAANPVGRRDHDAGRRARADQGRLPWPTCCWSTAIRLANLAILLDRSKLLGIMKAGAFHKEPELRSNRTRWSLPAA